MQIEQQIRSYIVDNFLFGEPGSLNDSQSLLESGVVDSTGVLELVLFLEQTYHITVSDEDLVPQKLDSIQRIAAFVRDKQGGGEYISQPVAKEASA